MGGRVGLQAQGAKVNVKGRAQVSRAQTAGAGGLKGKGGRKVGGRGGEQDGKRDASLAQSPGARWAKVGQGGRDGGARGEEGCKSWHRLQCKGDRGGQGGGHKRRETQQAEESLLAVLNTSRAIGGVDTLH